MKVAGTLARLSSQASVQGSSQSHSAVHGLPLIVTVLVLAWCWSFASVDAVPQAIQNNANNGNSNMDILNKRNNQFGNAAQQNIEGQAGVHGESYRVEKQANQGAMVDQKREEHGNPPELQKIVDRQKERSLESARKKAEVQKQIEEHEQSMLQKQKGMEEREKKRQERQQRLDQLRHQQEEQRLQQQQAERSNLDDYNKQRAREQKWVEDTQRKSRNKLQQQQQQQHLIQEQLQQSNKANALNNQANAHAAAFNRADQPAHGNNLKPVPAGVPNDNNNNNINSNNINNNNNNFNDNNILNVNNNNNMNRNNDNNNDINIKVPGEVKVLNKSIPNSHDSAVVGDKHSKREELLIRGQNDAPKRDELMVDSKLESPIRDENGFLVPPKLKKPVVWSVSDTEDNIKSKKHRNSNDNDDSFNNNANSNNNLQGNSNNNLVHDNNNAYGNNNNGILNNNDIDNSDNMYKQADSNGNQQSEHSNNAGQIYNEAGNRRPDVGGIRVNWDWEDFSIMFDNYGGAEMKVRRSPHPTTGEPWPLPQYYSKKENKVYKVSKELRFVPTGASCDILEEALARHLQRVLRGCVEDMYDNLQHAEGTFLEDPTLRYEKEEFLKAPTLSRVEIKVREACDKYPTLESDESYDLVVKKKKTYIWANEVWGALRGLETLGQLVWRGTDGLLYIKETVISDYPRFPHRGLHLDTSRHFLFKEVFLDILESMEMNKLNVLHWHIVDDQSFPYESKVYPELSRKGAFHPTYVYTQEDIMEIIEYARLRGIRVLPEFDTPGHTYSWGLSRPELLTQCYTGSIAVKGYLGPIDPSKNSTYRFLHTLFQEIMEVFKDQYLHLGGDEVPLGCWQSNPEVMTFANELQKKARASGNVNRPPSVNNDAYAYSMWSEEIKKVYEYYENRLISILHDIGQKRKKGVKYIMWQEVMNNNLQLPNDTIIQVWMGDMGDVMRAISMGYQVLYSTCWYLDHVEYGTKWPKYYHCDPADQSYGYQLDEKKILGGEVAFWSEYFSNENLIPLMWPRASAAAERLWSSKDVKNLDKAAERLSEHRCRMIKRGINAGEISGPGYCLHSPPKRKLYNDTIGCKGGNCTRTHNFVQIEDIELRLSQRGGSIADCGQVFSRGSSSLTIVLLLLLLVVVALLALSRSSSRLHRSRLCKNRSILLAFVVVLVVYFLCYTTLWMRVFEFSGSFHTTLQRDKVGDEKRADSVNGAHSNIVI